MRKLRIPSLLALSLGIALVLLEIWQSLRYLGHAETIADKEHAIGSLPISTTNNILHKQHTEDEESDLDTSTIVTTTTTTTRTTTTTNSTSTASLLVETTTQLLVVDILSVGSQTRPDFLRAQRETMGGHKTVRHFIGVTEQDDVDQGCHALERADIQAISSFCKIGPQDIVKDTPKAVIRQRRRAYADWRSFLKPKPNPTGWLCAQKRASDGFHRLLHEIYRYNNNNNNNLLAAALPDYLIFMDDDTFMDLTAVTNYLSQVYNAREPLVMAGCLIRFPFFKDPSYTLPWGGWGTILSRGALQNILRPIHCQPAAAAAQEKKDTFSQQACQRLKQNLFDESRYFSEGMSLADLMNAYVVSNSFANYKNWNEDAYFCAHSDWLWGFFFNYYNVGSHTGNPELQDVPEARTVSYRVSEFFAGRRMEAKKRMAMEGQCRYEREKCSADESHICHYVKPEQMHNLTAVHRQRNRDFYEDTAMEQQSWKAAWSKPATQTARTVRKKDASVEVANVAAGGRIPVFVYPSTNHSLEHELKHFLWDGVKHSSRLELTYNATLAPIWIVDVRRAGLSGIRYCSRFVQLVRESLAQKEALSLLQQWKVVFLHWNDSPMEDFLDCFRATRRLDSLRIHRFKRSVVSGRHWSNTTGFIEKGQLVNYGNWRDHSGAPVQHIGYGVRSDFVEGFERLLSTRAGGKPGLQSNAETIVRNTKRLTDVAHFWPQKGKGEKLVDRGKASVLRDAITETLSSKLRQTSLNLFFGLTGKAKDKGRNEAQDVYLEKLLDTKIVVVSQKDNWEDHYRLMEALASGAMVMTDPMLKLPDGLQDGESIVVYTSLEDLTSKVLFYLDAEEERLKIALAGYNVAMGKHRSWHMMENVVDTVLGINNR